VKVQKRVDRTHLPPYEDRRAHTAPPSRFEIFFLFPCCCSLKYSLCFAYFPPLCPSPNNRMKKQVMKPFRAPRRTVEMRQSPVHRKDNSARFKEMEKWMDKNVTGEGGKTSPVQSCATRR